MTVKRTTSASTGIAALSPNTRSMQKPRAEDEDAEMELEDDQEARRLFADASDPPDDRSTTVDPVVVGDSAFWKRKINPPTSLWRAHAPDAPSSFTSSSQVFADDPETGKDSWHEMAQGAKRLAGINVGTEQLTVKHFQDIFANAFDSEHDLFMTEDGSNMRQLALKLANSDPKRFFDADVYWFGVCLRAADVTHSWMAAHLLLGAPWKDREYFHFPGISSPVHTSQAGSSLQSALKTKKGPKTGRVNTTFADTVKKASKPPPEMPVEDSDLKPAAKTASKKPVLVNPYSIVKKPSVRPTVSETNIPNKYQRKHQLFMKFVLPPLEKESVQDLQAEAGNHVAKIVEALWKVDNSAMILPWDPKYPVSRSLRRHGGPPPKNRSQFQIYFQNGIWTSTGRTPYARCVVAFDGDPANFESEEFHQLLRSIMASARIEPVQARDVTEAGWLLGTHQEIFREDSFMAAHRLVPGLEKISLEFRVQDVIRRAKNSDSWKNRGLNKAVHVFCADSDVVLVRSTLQRLYSSASNGHNTPLGIRAKFIPNVYDNRFVKTPAIGRAAERATIKQRQFLERSMTSRVNGCLGLDRTLPDGTVTCRDALMAIRSVQFPELNLFLGVEEAEDSSDLIFAYHENVAHEAGYALTSLPVILTAHLGEGAWDWFEPGSKLRYDDYAWCPIRGVVEKAALGMSVEEYFATGLDSDDEFDSDEDEAQRVQVEPILLNFSIDLLATGNGNFNDSDSIATKRLQQRLITPAESPTDARTPMVPPAAIAPMPSTISVSEQSDPSDLMSTTDSLLANPAARAAILASLGLPPDYQPAPVTRTSIPPTSLVAEFDSQMSISTNPSFQALLAAADQENASPSDLLALQGTANPPTLDPPPADEAIEAQSTAQGRANG